MLIKVESVTLAENTKELDMFDPASIVLWTRESKWIESVMLALIAVLLIDVKLILRISRTVEFKMNEPEWLDDNDTALIRVALLSSVVLMTMLLRSVELMIEELIVSLRSWVELTITVLFNVVLNGRDPVTFEE